MAAYSQVANAYTPQVKAEAGRQAVAAEVALVRQRMWETIQSFHTDSIGKPAAKRIVDITARAAF